jgi:hypothetical protein
MGAIPISSDKYLPLNQWEYNSIRPGVVGSVGDVLLNPRYAQSSPDMPMRFDKSFNGPKESRLGSNVQNGTIKSYDSKGGPARTYDTNWGGRRNFKISHGYVYQDMRAPDKSVQPILGSTPDYSWHNKIATTIEAKRTGNLFLPLPHGYEPVAQTRGGAYPIIRGYAAYPGPSEITPTVVGTVDTGAHPGLRAISGRKSLKL